MTEEDTRKALVTGAARGIGRSIARRLVRDGYEVFLVDRDEALLESVSRELSGHPIVCDVTVEAEVERVAAQVGPLHLVVNNAGVWRYTSLLDTPTIEARHVLDVNVIGPFLCIRTFACNLVPGASIVNVASVSAERVPAGAGMYGPSKAALVALTKWAALELGGRGIRVNAVSPGMVQTDGNADAFADGRRAAMARTLPVAGFARATDIADVVAFLGSNAARFITGENVNVDGGYLLMGPMGLGTGTSIDSSDVPKRKAGENDAQI